MARLNEPPRKPTPVLALSSDADAAAASDPATAHPPMSPAVFGANLLNAARVDFRHSSPARMAPKTGKGRLSRVGLFTEPRRQNLARPRGRDVWDLPESPEKRPFQLHETVNREPLRILKKNKAPAQLQTDPQDHIESLEQQSSVDETPMPSSPPRTTLEPHNAVDGHVAIEQHLPNGAARCAVTSYKFDQPKGPRYEQCRNVGTNSTAHGPRCVRHVKKPGSVRCEYIINSEGGPVQCHVRAKFNKTTTCDKHAALNAKAVSPPKRKSDEDSHTQGRQPKSTKSQKHATVARNTQEHPGPTAADERPSRGSFTGSTCGVRIPERKSGNHEARKNASPKASPDSHQQNDVTQSDKPTASASTETTERISRTLKKTSKSKKPAKASPMPQNSDEEAQDSEPEGEDEDSGEEEDEQAAYTPEALQLVFDFLDLERRPGRCQTDVCLTLKRLCTKTCSRFQRQKLSLEVIAQITRTVRDMLKEVRAAKPDDDRRAIKLDTYAYIFRSLTRVLKSLYACLSKNCEDITASVDAMRIISPLIHDILVLKDCIAEWKVSIHGRYNGDRLIKDAQSHMIAPLRDVEAVFRKRLSILEEQEQRRNKLARLEQQMEERTEEVVRREGDVRTLRKRREQWQALHITRQQCEPDVSRRPRLWISTFNLEEKDANGVTFERVPLFENRTTLPPHHPSSIAETGSWSTEQETALLEGLQKYAGRLIRIAHHTLFLTDQTGPDVFHDIFKAYCRPGGPLREFTVLEIVTQAGSLRSSVSNLHQENGWQIPAWVKHIPALP
jgi:hypothetical protein